MAFWGMKRRSQIGPSSGVQGGSQVGLSYGVQGGIRGIPDRAIVGVQGRPLSGGEGSLGCGLTIDACENSDGEPGGEETMEGRNSSTWDPRIPDGHC